MGFLYGTGVGVPVSQARALVHYTLGSLGGSDYAQMALAYRHWAGVTLPSSCSKAMDLYMKVAHKGELCKDNYTLISKMKNKLMKSISIIRFY